MMTETIKRTLRQLGVGAKYKGFHLAALAVGAILENEDRLTSVTKEIYHDVAKMTGFSQTAVERNIRTVVARAWSCNQQALIQMAGYTLTTAPTVSEFLDIIANYVRRQLPPENGQRPY